MNIPTPTIITEERIEEREGVRDLERGQIRGGVGVDVDVDVDVDVVVVGERVGDERKPKEEKEERRPK